MSQLKTLLENSPREEIVEAMEGLITREVAKKKGVSGLGIRGGYQVVRKLRNGNMIHDAADRLLDDFVDVLSPIYDEAMARGVTFRTYVQGRESEVTQALLSVTDKMASKDNVNSVVQKTYSALRKGVEPHIHEAVPGVVGIIEEQGG